SIFPVTGRHCRSINYSSDRHPQPLHRHQQPDVVATRERGMFSPGKANGFVCRYKQAAQLA
ncbi:MAG: hypothetical protein KBH08_06165, partial [Brachymonas sp.]|nr:hypothetical protein [Brachymonas sp.]